MNRCLSIVLSAIVALLSGCSGNKPQAVHGIFTLNGEPTDNVSLTFHPSDPKQSSGFATTKDLGRFDIELLPGDYKVTVASITQQAIAPVDINSRIMAEGQRRDLAALPPEQRELAKSKLEDDGLLLKQPPASPIPESYSNVLSTPLKITIPAKGAVELGVTSPTK